MGKTWRKERSDWEDRRSKKGFVKRQKNIWRETEIEEENEYADREEFEDDLETEAKYK